MEDNFLKSQTQTANIPKKKPVEELQVEKSQEEVEQSPAENSGPKIEPVKNRLAQERRKQTIEIEFDGIKIPLETESYDFEYPKHIQEETGILGYERTKISNDAIFDALKASKKKTRSIDFTISNNIEKIKKKKRVRIDYKTENARVIGGSILMELSNGEYPRFCYNHKMNASIHSSKQESAQSNAFMEDKFFVQRMYGLNRTEKHLENFQKKEIYNNPAYAEERDRKKIFCAFDKKTGAILEDELYPGDIPEVLQKNPEAFIAPQRDGINLLVSNFFNGLKIDSTSFGFPMKLESHMKDYMGQCLHFYSNKKNGIKPEIASTIFGGHLENSLLMLSLDEILRDEELLAKMLAMINKYPESPDPDKAKTALICKIFEKICIKYELKIDSLVSEYTWRDKFVSRDRNIQESLIAHVALALDIIGDPESYSIQGDGDHAYLPVFINHDEIPQLAWGHAKYAHYSNEKSFNFFKFKHAEHLPEPQKVKHEE
jgi:hypothetical protein